MELFIHSVVHKVNKRSTKHLEPGDIADRVPVFITWFSPNLGRSTGNLRFHMNMRVVSVTKIGLWPYYATFMEMARLPGTRISSVRPELDCQLWDICALSAVQIGSKG